MTEQPTTSESRRFPRLKESCRIRYKQIDGSGLEGELTEAITVNISGGGVCFNADERIDPGTLLAIELLVPDFTSPVVSLGRVAWCDPAATQSFDVGIEFWWIGWGDDSAQRAISDHIKRSLEE